MRWFSKPFLFLLTINVNGNIFGGWVMAQVDLAASVLPFRLARGRVTTVAVNAFVFKQPVQVGDLLSFLQKSFERETLQLVRTLTGLQSPAHI